MTKYCSLLLLVLSTLCLLGCPYIAHDPSDAPEQVTAEDVQGCYYSEIINEDTYIDKKLPNVEGKRPAQGREKRFDRILCKEICFEGDSAKVVVRGFALTYDITGQFIEDTIPYTLWESDETVYKETFPVSFLEPANDGVFHSNIITKFPVSLDTDKPTYYKGSFKFLVFSALSKGVFSKNGALKKISVTRYDSKEEFSTKGWDVCKGF